MHLKHELLSNLTFLTRKSDGKIHFNYEFTKPAQRYFKGDIRSSTKMSRLYLSWLLLYIYPGSHWDDLSTQFIDQALVSGSFLEYDFGSNSYESGQLDNALLRLKENINRLKYSAQTTENWRLLFVNKYWPLFGKDGEVSVDNLDLVMAIGMANNEENVVQLSVALVKALGGDLSKLSDLNINSSSPLPESAEQMSKEIPDEIEIADWIKNSLE